jgi:hypothetical protein
VERVGLGGGQLDGGGGGCWVTLTLAIGG